MRETTSTAIPATFVGIDVAKYRLDVLVRPTGEHWIVIHDDGALPALVRRLVGLRSALVCLEATGGLQTRVPAELAAAGLPVAIARFANAVWPSARPLEDAASLALKALVARRRELVAMRVAETNGLGTTSIERVRQSISAVIETLERQIVALDGDINRQVRDSPAWRAREDLLRTVPGVGPNTARTLLAG
jgi:transposase